MKEPMKAATHAANPPAPVRKSFEEWRDLIEKTMPNAESMDKCYLAFALTDSAPVLVNAEFLIPAPVAAYLLLGRFPVKAYLENALEASISGDYDDSGAYGNGEAASRLFGFEQGNADGISCRLAEFIGWRKTGEE